MQGLADELGVSRVTLFRRVGGREELLSQALWRLTERMLEIAVERWEAERPEGELHTPGTIRHINAMVAGSAGLRRLLDDEPALTMRVLTDPRGKVQSGIVAFNEVLLRRDMEEFGLVTIIEPSALAYALRPAGRVVPLRGRDRGAQARRRHRQPAAAGHHRGHPALGEPRAGCLGFPTDAGLWSLASSSCTLASCSASSRLASRVRQRPRSSGMDSRKKMMPPKQIQYQVFHCPAVLAAAFCTAAACAFR